jgi:predicted phage terminase large subunit-like protein
MKASAALRLMHNLDAKLSHYNPKKEQRFVDEAAMMEKDFYTFFKGAWNVMEPGREFIDGWHIQASCEHLEALYNLEIQKLLWNVPPGTCKSTIFAVCFHAWIWSKEPGFQSMFSSYGSKLSTRDSVACRRLIESKWFYDRWGNKCQLTEDVNNKLRFDNKQGGYRLATSIKGAATGEHVDLIGFDDPNNASETESEVKREGTNEICDRVMSSRFNNPKTGRLCIVQQRLHSQDYSGHILAKNMPDLVHLCLPMEFERSRRCTTIPLKMTDGEIWKDPRIKDGELLWPQFFDEVHVGKLKIDMASEYVIAGQLQQRPSPGEGGILKKGWFQWWKEPSPPQCHYILQSWDTALSTKPDACYSCCTTWGVFKDDHGVSQVMLLDTWHGRVEYPDLRRMAIRLAHNYHDTHIDHPVPEDYVLKPDMILIEAKANGLSLIQDLSRANLIVNRFDPVKHGGGDKTVRARLMSHILEAGRIWVPAKPPHYTSLRAYADVFVESCSKFPNDADSRDYVDSMSQAIIKLMMSGLIGNPDDAYISTQYNRWQGEKFY